MSRQSRPLLYTDANFRVLAGSEFDVELRIAYDLNDNPEYVGYARTGTSEDEDLWKIFLLTYDVNENIVSKTWPQINGRASADYSFSWTDRATYTYS